MNRTVLHNGSKLQNNYRVKTIFIRLTYSRYSKFEDRIDSLNLKHSTYI